MTRLRFDSDLRLGRSGPAPDADEDASHGRSVTMLNDEAGGTRIRWRRDDPSVRRSLTGVEFRRQRSI
jgi:hypothetical protein